MKYPRNVFYHFKLTVFFVFFDILRIEMRDFAAGAITVSIGPASSIGTWHIPLGEH
jgi:hypothetical protein